MKKIIIFVMFASVCPLAGMNERKKMTIEEELSNHHHSCLAKGTLDLLNNQTLRILDAAAINIDESRLKIHDPLVQENLVKYLTQELVTLKNLQEIREALARSCSISKQELHKLDLEIHQQNIEVIATNNAIVICTSHALFPLSAILNKGSL